MAKTMSKDIWHTANEKPEPFKTFVFKTDKGNTCSDMLSTNRDWNPILLPEFYSMDDFDKAERIIKWCYVDDLLALETENKDLSDKIGKLESELDRTRKALDRAKLILKNLLPYLNGYERLDVEKAITEITALEQKDVK